MFSNSSKYFLIQIELEKQFFVYLRFYVPRKNFSLIWRCHHYQWRAAQFKPMLSAFSREGSLLRHTCCGTGPLFEVSSEGPPHLVASYDTWGCEGSILSWILTGSYSAKVLNKAIDFCIMHEYTLYFFSFIFWDKILDSVNGFAF
jgi:hypothetical protein